MLKDGRLYWDQAFSLSIIHCLFSLSPSIFLFVSQSLSLSLSLSSFSLYAARPEWAIVKNPSSVAPDWAPAGAPNTRNSEMFLFAVRRHCDFFVIAELRLKLADPSAHQPASSRTPPSDSKMEAARKKPAAAAKKESAKKIAEAAATAVADKEGAAAGSAQPSGAQSSQSPAKKELLGNSVYDHLLKMSPMKTELSASAPLQPDSEPKLRRFKLAEHLRQEDSCDDEPEAPRKYRKLGSPSPAAKQPKARSVPSSPAKVESAQLLAALKKEAQTAAAAAKEESAEASVQVPAEEAKDTSIVPALQAEVMKDFKPPKGMKHPEKIFNRYCESVFHGDLLDSFKAVGLVFCGDVSSFEKELSIEDALYFGREILKAEADSKEMRVRVKIEHRVSHGLSFNVKVVCGGETKQAASCCFKSSRDSVKQVVAFVKHALGWRAFLLTLSQRPVRDFDAVKDFAAVVKDHLELVVCK